jgi:hypothetical protein
MEIPVQLPDFFDGVPTITMIDPLSHFLGAAAGGHLVYSYSDAVKLAGHSCPTVAGAYLMTRAALKHLFGDETPERGSIRVDMRETDDEGVTGVIANVIGLITGAAGQGGFKGIGGQFQRSNLLSFGVEQTQSVRFTRLDTGQSIGTDYDASLVPPDDAMMPLMQTIMSGNAGAAEIAMFGSIWQKRVEAIMTSEDLWTDMVQLS